MRELRINSLANTHPNIMAVEKVYAWEEEVPIRKYVLVFVMKLIDTNLKREMQQR